MSYGFTLLGVGGLLGLNRTVDLDALQVGVRDGTLNSILFPTDVVANAPRIISDLKRVFPPHEDRFLIGPMGKLGWGTPTLISVEIGLILEIPRPAFAILGVLRVQLPAEEFGTIYLQVNFVRQRRLREGTASVRRVALRLARADLPAHRRHGAAHLLGRRPEFPADRRRIPSGLHAAADEHRDAEPSRHGDRRRASRACAPRCTSRSRPTPCSSARASRSCTASSFFNVFGFVGLDVLIQFNPFKFIAEISAMFGVRTGLGRAVRHPGHAARSKGPTPWHVRGEASFEIGFIIKVRLSANFDVTRRRVAQHAAAGDRRARRDSEGARQRRQLARRAAARRRTSTSRCASCRRPGDALVLHPFGALEISQKVVPLNIAIQRFGASRPDRGSVFRIAPAQINSADVADDGVDRAVRSGAVLRLDDAEKLSRPSFARYDSGIVIGADNAPQTDFCRERDVQYEVDLSAGASSGPASSSSSPRRSSTGVRPRRRRVRNRRCRRQSRAPSPVAAEHVSRAPETYAVVSTLDMTLHAAPLVFDSATAADQAVARLIAGQPELTGAVQVVPSAQVRHAA